MEVWKDGNNYILITDRIYSIRDDRVSSWDSEYIEHTRNMLIKLGYVKCKID